MKRLLIYMFIFLYQLSSVSGKVYIHYCSGEVSNISLINDHTKGCSNCSKKSETAFSCCKNEVHQLKSTGNHLLQKTELHSASFKIFYHSGFPAFKDFFVSKKLYVKNIIDDSAEPVNSYPIFIRFRSLII